MRKFIQGITFTLALLVAAGLGLSLLGLINTDADQSPSRLEKWLAAETLEASVERRAPRVNNPLPASDAHLIEGMKTYVMACAECHGGLDRKPSVFGAALHPPAPQLIMQPMHDPEWEIFHLIKHGVRNTGMPAWKGLMTDDEMWKMTAFLSRIEKLPAAVQEEWKKASGQ